MTLWNRIAVLVTKVLHTVQSTTLSNTMLPSLKMIYGVKLYQIFSSDSIASMNENQWMEFSTFILQVPGKDVLKYLNKRSIASKAKSFGWLNTLELYKRLGKKEKTQVIFLQILKNAVDRAQQNVLTV